MNAQRLAALAAACLAAACALANGETPAMSDARPAFAKALGAPPQEISAFVAVPLSASAQPSALWLGSRMVSGEPQAWAIAVCGSGPCPGDPVSLPTASALAVMAIVDLQGAPFKLDLRKPPKAQAVPQKPKSPAALILARHKLDSGEERDTLVLLSAAKAPEILLQEITRSTLPNGGGHESTELSLVKPPRGPWLDLRLLQHTLPAKGQQPFAPGPPLALQFAYRDGAYQRVR